LRLPSSPLFPTRRSSDLSVGTGRRGFFQDDRLRLPGACTKQPKLAFIGEVQGQPTISLHQQNRAGEPPTLTPPVESGSPLWPWRSEEHTSELQSRENLVC